jgi:hypothetical protein
MKKFRWPLLVLLACVPAMTLAAPPGTMRLDLQHSGDAGSEQYALERVVVEPLPWPGNPARPLDDSNRGVNLFEVIDADSGEVVYSRGFSTVFGEWQSTAEARGMRRSFQESLRFPMPARPVQVRVSRRGADQRFVPVWSVAVDPAALDVERATRPAPARPVAIRENGPPAEKVDLLVLGDGYAADELEKFLADARRLTDHLFSVPPFKARAADFNVWRSPCPCRSRASAGHPRGPIAPAPWACATTSSAANAMP